MGDQPVSASLDENRRTIEVLYELPASQGVAIRNFDIAGLPPAKAMLLYLEGLSDKKNGHGSNYGARTINVTPRSRIKG